MPRTRAPPPFFGISTARTGPGKYDPDDMRFHSLNRLSCRRPANCSIVTPSGPAAPPFSSTFSHASQMRRFGMSCDLPCNFGSCMRFLPSGCPSHTNPDDPSPWLRPDRDKPGLHGYYGRVRPRGPRRYSAPRVSSAWGPPSRPRGPPRRLCQATRSHVSYERLDQVHAAYTPGTAWAVNGYLPDSSQDIVQALVLMPAEHLSALPTAEASSRPSLISLIHTCRDHVPTFPAPFSTTVFSQGTGGWFDDSC